MNDLIREFPQDIFLEIVDFCNATCKLCDYSRLNNLKKKKSFISLKAIQKIAEQIGHRDIDIYFQSGEPLLHPSFVMITNLIKRKCPNARLHLTTNGSLLSKHFHLLDSLSTITFSIDGLWHTSSTIRCLPSQQNEVKNFLRKSNISKKWGVSLVIQADNIDEIEDYCKYWIRQNTHYINIIHPHGTSLEHANEFNRLSIGYTGRRHHWNQKEVNKIDLFLLFNQLSKISSISEKINIYPKLSWEELINFYNGTLSKKGWCCHKPWQSIEILANGAIVLSSLCADLDLGNIFNENVSILKSWHSPILSDFREKLKQSGAFPICQRCCGYNL